MASIIDRVAQLSGLVVYLIVGVLVLAEDTILVGLFVPGETAAILGGVAASRGQASLPTLCAVVVIAAIIGDSIGYAIGARYGERLLRVRALRRRQDQVRSGQDLLRRRGGPAVLIGRFVGFVRAVIPFLAGLSHMRYRRFFVYNVIGGLLWGTGAVLLGYLASGSYRVLARTLGPATAGVIVALVLVALIVWWVRRRRRT